MLVGSRIGPFEIERELGSGAMGTVYRAQWHREGGRIDTVALKVVALGLLGNESAMARFDRESTILKQLRHPNIVRLVATGRHRKTPFIAMEFVDGTPLDKKLALSGRVGWQDAVVWAKQLCAALQHAHDKGIVHRDLKPSNLMITRDGTLKLTDFGIAKDTDLTALTGANSTIGTAAYMSPEQCRGDRTLGPKSDLYSLGVVLFELVTGAKPFHADNTVDMFLKHVNEKPPRPSVLNPDVPRWLDNLIIFLLEKDKEKRPLDAATVGKMLTDIEEKVATQQSVGVDVANARKADRPMLDAPPSEEDKKAVQTIRNLTTTGVRKKKKKTTPWYQKPWVSMVGILAVLGAIAFAVCEGVKPPSLDTMYAAFEAKEKPEDQLEVAKEILATYGSSTDGRMDKVRNKYRDLQTLHLDRVLNNRFKNGMTEKAESNDPEAYKAAMNALNAEQAGDLKVAADNWKKARDRFQPPDMNNLAALDKDATLKAEWYWLADQRAKLLEQTVPDEYKKLVDQVEFNQLREITKTYDVTDPVGLASLALRFDQFGDKNKAHHNWKLLAEQIDTSKDPAQRAWYLMATWRMTELGSELPKDKDATTHREELLGKKINQLEVDAKGPAANPSEIVPRRDVRIVCREIIALYGDDPSETIKGIVARAKRLLETMAEKTK